MRYFFQGLSIETFKILSDLTSLYSGAIVLELQAE